jgi:hypothetical protein
VLISLPALKSFPLYDHQVNLHQGNLQLTINRFDLDYLLRNSIMRVAEERFMPKLKAGDKAPDFKLEDQQGRKVKLSDFKGRKLLLYFYPKADTLG